MAEKSIVVVVVVLPEPFQGMGTWRNSTVTQQSGHVSRSGLSRSGLKVWPIVSSVAESIKELFKAITVVIA